MRSYNTRSKGQPEFQFNPEIGRTQRKNRQAKTNPEMAAQNQNQQRLFGDFYVPNFDNTQVAREIEAESYTIPPALINLIQNGAIFQGLENEDPNAHVKAFLNLCNTCKLPNISQDEVRRILFPFSLRSQALSWYDAIQGHAMESFEELVRRFTVKYFPPAKMDRLRNEIHQFRQSDQESFAESWERFQELLRKCPNKLVEEEYELQLFYKGLTPENRNIVNASAGGSLKDKTYAAVKELFQKIAENGSTGQPDRTIHQRKQACVLQPDSATELGAQLALLTNKMSAMEAKMEGRSTIICGLCQGSHHTDQCHLICAPVNFIKDQQRPAYNQQWNQQQRPPMQNWNNQGQGQNQRVWQEPENGQWTQNNAANTSGFKRIPPGYVNAPQGQQEGRSTFEDTMLRKMDVLLGNNQRYDKILEEQGKRTSVLETNMKNLEVAMGQLAQDIRKRPVGGLPTDTEVNPRGKEPA